MRTNSNYFKGRIVLGVHEIASRYGLNDVVMLNDYNMIEAKASGADCDQIYISGLSVSGKKWEELEIYGKIDGIATGQFREAKIIASVDAMARQVSRILKARGVSVVDCITGNKGYL